MEMQNKLPATLNDAAVNILKETARANPLLRFKKGKYLIGEDEIPAGREYVAFLRSLAAAEHVAA
jgi:hypothetical protein